MSFSFLFAFFVLPVELIPIDFSHVFDCHSFQGAVVRAFDTRPTVKEQVQSMGAEFLELNFKVEKDDSMIDRKKKQEIHFD